MYKRSNTILGYSKFANQTNDILVKHDLINPDDILKLNRMFQLCLAKEHKFKVKENTMKEIYIVMYAYYSDWEIYGYFSDREEADKYCAKHPQMELQVFAVSCYDNKEDLSNIRLRYRHHVLFSHNNFSELTVLKNAWKYDTYIADFPNSNKIEIGDAWIKIYVNTDYADKERAIKVATDLVYQFLHSCEGSPPNEGVVNFNKILSAEEDERKRIAEEEKQKEKEPQELARLKAKYEGK